MTPDSGRAAVRHVEVFMSRRSGVNVQVPCWCFIGADHLYDAWRGSEPDAAVAAESDRTPPSTPSGSPPLAP
jgi:hypothetical protein